jgi:hypothetical protein
MKSIRMFAVAVVFMGLASIAGASPLDLFTIIGGGNTVSFTLPGSPTPTGTDAACPANLPPEFCISGVTATVNGVTETGDVVEFFDISQLGGLALLSGGAFPPLVDTIGAQLYSGPVTSPTFLLGTFDQTSFLDGGAITVTISQVPEPVSLVLLGSGVLGGVGFLRRRR